MIQWLFVKSGARKYRLSPAALAPSSTSLAASTLSWVGS